MKRCSASLIMRKWKSKLQWGTTSYQSEWQHLHSHIWSVILDDDWTSPTKQETSPYDLFDSFFMTALGPRRGLSSAAARGAALPCSALASHCSGSSCCRSQALGARASVIAARGLSSCGSWVCQSKACGVLLDQGSSLCPLPWQVDSSPLNHQGSPPCGLLNRLVWASLQHGSWVPRVSIPGGRKWGLEGLNTVILSFLLYSIGWGPV